MAIWKVLILWIDKNDANPRAASATDWENKTVHLAELDFVLQK